MISLLRELFPQAVSVLAHEVDGILLTVFLASFVFLGSLSLLLVFYLIRGWEQAGARSEAAESQEKKSQVSMALGLALLLGGWLGLFAWGFQVFVSHQVVPRDPVVVLAKATPEGWSFDYTHGVSQQGELTVPVDRPVQLHFDTENQTVAFSVPVFRLHAQAVAGRTNEAWFQATKMGQYPVLGHGGVEGDGQETVVNVISAEEFEKWIQEGAATQVTGTLEEVGAQLYQQNACFTCHSVDGSPGIGPTWKGIYGKQERLNDGTSVEVNDEYIRESILNPAVKITEGFQPIMPSYEGMLNDDQIAAITAYIKSLKDES